MTSFQKFRKKQEPAGGRQRNWKVEEGKKAQEVKERKQLQEHSQECLCHKCGGRRRERGWRGIR